MDFSVLFDTCYCDLYLLRLRKKDKSGYVYRCFDDLIYAFQVINIYKKYNNPYEYYILDLIRAKDNKIIHLTCDYLSKKKGGL